jgi:hypothetical protein
MAQQWGKHIIVNDDYMGFQCVPSVIHIPCIQGSQNKVLGIRVCVTLCLETVFYNETIY